MTIAPLRSPAGERPRLKSGDSAGSTPAGGTAARLCAGCNRAFLAYVPRFPDEPYFCANCAIRRSDGFAPQAGDLVRLADRPYRLRYVVLAITGEESTLRRLGFPDDPAFRAHASALMP